MDNIDIIKTYSKVLIGMGVDKNAVPELVVVLAVITLDIGAKSICETFGKGEG